MNIFKLQSVYMCILSMSNEEMSNTTVWSHWSKNIDEGINDLMSYWNKI